MKNIGKMICVCLLSLIGFRSAAAESVILMIGDGMGANHIACAQKDMPLFMTTLPVKGWVKTRSANKEITDSAASATAYACGRKTNNDYVGKLPNGQDCLTIAEEAVKKGKAVGIYSTDHNTGATPASFYAHAKHRHDKKTIQKYRGKAEEDMDIETSVPEISDITSGKLKDLSEEADDFFAMFEGGLIDKKSHKNKLQEMKEELYDFDYAVMKAVRFARKNPDVTVIVLADHECGGLTKECTFTTDKHTGVDIPLFAYGKFAKMFEGVQDNTDIYQKIKLILFHEEY